MALWRPSLTPAARGPEPAAAASQRHASPPAAATHTMTSAHHRRPEPERMPMNSEITHPRYYFLLERLCLLEPGLRTAGPTGSWVKMRSGGTFSVALRTAPPASPPGVAMNQPPEKCSDT